MAVQALPAVPTAESVSRVILPDGTVVLSRANHASNAVIVQGLIRAGEVDVPPEKNGLSRFMAECLTRGTRSRSMSALYEAAESLGASFSTYGSMHTIRFGARCLAEDVPTLVGLLSETLQQPAFPEDEIELVRGEILTEIDERDQNTRSVADMTFGGLLYPPEHPYSRSLEGTCESIEDITRQDLIRFYERTVPTRPMILTVVGDIEPARVGDILARHWQTSPKGRTGEVPPLPPAGDRTTRLSQHSVIEDKYQIDISWGAVGPRRADADADFVPANLANLVLGGFGLMGRLGQTVREEQGLAYYASSRLGAGLGPAPWVCVAGVAPEHYTKALASIEAEVRKLQEEDVPQSELDDCKAHLIGSLPLKLESNEGTAAIMTEIELYGLGWDYLQRFTDVVQSVTPDQIREVARKYLDPARIVMASAGPEV